jgi:hypothetical protein
MGTSNICRVCGARTDERSCPQCGATTERSNLTAYLAGQPTGMTASAGSRGSDRSASAAPGDFGNTARALPSASGFPAPPPAHASTRPRPRSLTLHLRVLLVVPLAMLGFLILVVFLLGSGESNWPAGFAVVTTLGVLGLVNAAFLWPLFHGFGWARITYICVYWMSVAAAILGVLMRDATFPTVGRLCATIVAASYVTWFLTRPEAVSWYERNRRD